MLSVHFWVTKNVLGRIMVGLRWYSEVDEEGNTQWKYMSDVNFKPNARDKNIFWYGIYLWPAMWMLFFVFDIFKFHWAWLLLDGIAVVLSCTQFYGYWLCRRDADSKANEVSITD